MNIWQTIVNNFSNGANAANGEVISPWFASGLGIGIVFLGLVAIVLICWVSSLVCRAAVKGETKPVEEVKPAVSEEIPNRQELVAAVSVAIAESMGKDVSGIRIVSLKKL